MRSSRPDNQESHCWRCLLRREICVCPILPAIRTQTEFLILRHIYETNRPGNTGRLVSLALPNSRLISCGGGTRIGLLPMDEELLHASETWLLWPDGPDEQTGISDAARPERIVVLDATWHQARRLYRKMPLLWKMPRLVLPPPVQDRKRLREQRRPDGMSTLEAVAAAISLLEGQARAEPLEKLYDEVVRRKSILRWGVKA